MTICQCVQAVMARWAQRGGNTAKPSPFAILWHYTLTVYDRANSHNRPPTDLNKAGQELNMGTYVLTYSSPANEEAVCIYNSRGKVLGNDTNSTRNADLTPESHKEATNWKDMTGYSSPCWFILHWDISISQIKTNEHIHGIDGYAVSLVHVRKRHKPSQGNSTIEKTPSEARQHLKELHNPMCFI